MSEPTTPGAAQPPVPPTTRELEAEVKRSRTELGDTLDELMVRLSPKYQAQHLAGSTKQAASDAGTFVTGGGLPDDNPRRARNAKALLGVVAAGAVVVAVLVIRAARR